MKTKERPQSQGVGAKQEAAAENDQGKLFMRDSWSKRVF